MDIFKNKGNNLSLLLYIITFIPLALFTGWCFSMLWGWWITPLTNISLNAAQALGVCLTIKFLGIDFRDLQINEGKDEIAWWEVELTTVILKLILLGINYIIYLFLSSFN